MCSDETARDEPAVDYLHLEIEGGRQQHPMLKTMREQLAFEPADHDLSAALGLEVWIHDTECLDASEEDVDEAL